MKEFNSEIRGVGYYILVVIILIIFISPIQSLYDKYIVEKIITKAHREGYGFIVAAVIVTTIFIFGAFIWGKIRFLKVKLNKILTLTVLLSLLTYFRFYDDHYSYYPLYKGYAKLVILDLPYFLLLLSYLVLLKNRLIVRNFTVNDGNYFFQDTAIDNSEEDEFDRKNVFKGLLDSLKLISFDSKEGFVVGINNEWGEGKTSFLNVLRKELPDSETIIIDFNPWISSNSENISIDFFNTVDSILQKFVETDTSLRNYASELHSIDSAFNPLKYFPGKWGKRKNYKEYIEEISEIIIKINKKIIILIDDIDRLDNKEVFELLRTIRNSANFPRTLFIIPFHHEYLVNAVGNHGIHNPSQYISKIFQMEISLPPISKSNLQAMLMKLFNGLLGKLPKITGKDKFEFEQQFESLVYNNSTNHSAIPKFDKVHNVLFGKFRNKRDLIRFYNNLAINFYANHEWIYLPDLFILEAIKLLDNDVYDILNKSDDYIYSDKGVIFTKSYKLRDGNNTPDALVWLNSKTSVFEISDYLNEKYCDPQVKKRMLDLITELFEEPNSNEFNNQFAFSNVESKANYLNYRENLLNINI